MRVEKSEVFIYENLFQRDRQVKRKKRKKNSSFLIFGNQDSRFKSQESRFKRRWLKCCLVSPRFYGRLWARAGDHRSHNHACITNWLPHVMIRYCYYGHSDKDGDENEHTRVDWNIDLSACGDFSILHVHCDNVSSFLTALLLLALTGVLQEPKDVWRTSEPSEHLTLLTCSEKSYDSGRS